MARVVLGVTNKVWELRNISQKRRRATLVSLHKKNHPLCIDNYRGISLMGVTLKLLVLCRFVEQEGLV